MARTRQRPPLAFYLLSVCLTMAAVLILAEVGVRLYLLMKGRTHYTYWPDVQTGKVHAPNNRFRYTYATAEGKAAVSQSTNSLGLPDGDVAVPKPAGVVRILVLGDSFTEAFQVPQERNFISLLEEALNHREGAPVYEVINAGISGASPIAEYQRYRTQLRHIDADVVLVQLFANDVFDDQRTLAMSAVDQRGRPVFMPHYFDEARSGKVLSPDGTVAYPTTLWRHIMPHSRLAELIAVRVARLREKSPYNRRMNAQPRFQHGHQFFIIRAKDGLFQDRMFRDASLKITERYLTMLRDEVEGDGAAFGMFYIPMEGQLQREHYGKHVRSYTNERLGRYLNDALQAFSTSEGIAFLDLLPAFDAHQPSLYLDVDGHLNEAGHAKTAEELLKFLTASDLK